MTADNIVGLILAVLLTAYLVAALAASREVLMSAASWAQFLVFVALVFATAPLIGWYMALVYGEGKKAPGDRVFLPIERAVYRICRVDENQEQRWTTYAFAVIGFSIFSLISLYLLLRFQGSLPLNPNNFPGPVHHLSWNTAVSFIDQHQLAVVRRRDDDEQPLADARARGPQLHVGRGRHGRPGGLHPRPGPPAGIDPRQLLGRPDPHDDAHPRARSRSCSRSCSSARA